MAWEQVLSPEVMARLTATPGGSGWSDATSRPFTEGGRTYQRDEQGNVYAYDPNKQEAGKDRFGVYDQTGKFSNEGTFKTDDAAQTFMMMLAAAGGMAALPGGALSSTMGQGSMAAQAGLEGGAGAGGATNALAGLPGGANGGYGIVGGATEPVTAVNLSGAGGAAGAAGAAGGAGGAGGGLSSLLPAGGAASLVGPALTAGAGLYGASVAKDAAGDQVKAAGDANALLREMFYKNIELNEPFRQGGLQGQNALLTALGLQDGDNKGWAMKDFGMADFQADPGYQFRQDEGQKAIDRFAASRGRFNSGRTAKDLTRFNQDLGSQEYGNAYNRFQTNRTNKLNPLQSLAGVGQSVSRDMGNAGMNYAGAAGQNITNAGDARAAGRVGSANAITGAVGQGISQYQNNQLMEQLLRRP